MSSFALTHPAPRSGGLRALLDRLRPAAPAPALPIEQLKALSDSLLNDIGVDPRSVPRPAHEEVVRLGLLDCGWQSLRGPHWR